MGVPPPVKKACDACHRRKVRCTGAQPCKNCEQANLQCTYLAIPQKKGPKGFRAKVISGIRDAQQRTHTAVLSPSRSIGAGAGAGAGAGTATAIATSSSTTATEQQPPLFDFNSVATPATVTLPYGRTPGRLPQHTIDTCLDIFFKCFYPTYPIFRRQNLLDKIQDGGIDDDPEFYCLVGAICALIMVQATVTVSMPVGGGMRKATKFTKDSGSGSGSGSNNSEGGGGGGGGDPPQSQRLDYATLLIQEVVSVRKSIDYIENATLLAVQTSFFLFGSYFGLEKQKACWFYLRESATIAQMMGMHKESAYESGDMIENVYKRRTYWLILITERAYGLERHKPLSLYTSIALPVFGPGDDDEHIANGLVYLASLFCCIDDKFMSLWNKVETDCSAAWVSGLQHRILNMLPTELKTTQYQAADIKITQHWLRTVVWQLGIMNGVLSSTSTDSALTFKYPIEIAQDLQSCLQGMDLSSMEVHGIGLIEKLFDVACTLLDVIAYVPLDSSTSTSGPSPQHVFNCYLGLITQLHGGTSRYLPLLLAKVSDSLPPVLAAVQHDTTPLIKQGYAGASDNMPTPDMPQDYGVRLAGTANLSVSQLLGPGDLVPDQTHTSSYSSIASPSTVDENTKLERYGQAMAMTAHGTEGIRAHWANTTTAGSPDAQEQSLKNGQWL